MHYFNISKIKVLYFRDVFSENLSCSLKHNQNLDVLPVYSVVHKGYLLRKEHIAPL